MDFKPWAFADIFSKMHKMSLLLTLLIANVEIQPFKRKSHFWKICMYYALDSFPILTDFSNETAGYNNGFNVVK